jgi:hypothetical protein
MKSLEDEFGPGARQQIPVIIVQSPGVWDLSEYEKPAERTEKDLLIEIAEAAIRLAEQAGADSNDVETLSMLVESVR